MPVQNENYYISHIKTKLLKDRVSQLKNSGEFRSVFHTGIQLHNVAAAHHEENSFQQTCVFLGVQEVEDVRMPRFDVNSERSRSLVGRNYLHINSCLFYNLWTIRLSLKKYETVSHKRLLLQL